MNDTGAGLAFPDLVLVQQGGQGEVSARGHRQSYVMGGTCCGAKSWVWKQQGWKGTHQRGASRAWLREGRLGG